MSEHGCAALVGTLIMKICSANRRKRIPFHSPTERVTDCIIRCGRSGLLHSSVLRTRIKVVVSVGLDVSCVCVRPMGVSTVDSVVFADLCSSSVMTQLMLDAV